MKIKRGHIMEYKIVNAKEIAEYGFNITIIHPDNMKTVHLCSPNDSDMEMNTVEDAEYWINHYND